MPNNVDSGSSAVKVVGKVLFTAVKPYYSKEDLQADISRHLVEPGGAYSWNDEDTTRIFGWEIGACKALPQPQAPPVLVRIKRSLFALSAAPEG